MCPSVSDLCFCMFMLSVNVKSEGAPDNILISVPKAQQVKGQSGFRSSTLTKPPIVVVVPILPLVKSKSISKM